MHTHFLAHGLGHARLTPVPLPIDVLKDVTIVLQSSSSDYLFVHNEMIWN